MNLGFVSMNTPEEVPIDVLARGLEERGFESLWVGEHSHIPTSRVTPYPVGGDLPAPYLRMMDPYVSLMAAADASSSLLLGTAVALPLERDVLALAKTVATLDRLCGGRFCFGVGVGWNEEELANHRPTPWPRRYGALAECVAAMQSLWCEEEASFHGEHYDFDPLWSQPKPLQEPHPPILCGAAGRVGTRHAVAWADGWMPMDIALGDVARKIGRFREAAEVAGRADIPISIVAFGDPTLGTLIEYAELGVVRTILGAGREDWEDSSTTLAFLDRYADHAKALTEAGS
jgi:probable F420-dependent oxidoreductase